MPGLFAGTPLERPVTCERCEKPLEQCACPRDASGSILLPKHQPVRVRREKRSGKIVTVITGLDPAANDLPEMLRQFKKRLATGGTVSGSDIELQGDNRDRVLESLREMGFPAKAAGG